MDRQITTDKIKRSLFGADTTLSIKYLSIIISIFLIIGIYSLYDYDAVNFLSGEPGIVFAMAIPIVAVSLLAFVNDGYVPCCLILVTQVYVFDIFLIWDSAFPTGPQTTLGMFVVEPLTAGIEYALLFGTPAYVVGRGAKFLVNYYRTSR